MKKIVHYKPHADDIIVVGQNGYVHEPLDHPGPLVSNTRPVITSKVVTIAEGYFETENTIYAKAHFS